MHCKKFVNRSGQHIILMDHGVGMFGEEQATRVLYLPLVALLMKYQEDFLMEQMNTVQILIMRMKLLHDILLMAKAIHSMEECGGMPPNPLKGRKSKRYP